MAEKCLKCEKGEMEKLIEKRIKPRFFVKMAVPNEIQGMKGIIYRCNNCGYIDAYLK